jgi:hypothetical protein
MLGPSRITNPSLIKLLRKYATTTNSKPKKDYFGSAWVIENYSSGLSGLTLKPDWPVPCLTDPNEVLVRVRATSINPLDVMMAQGYGHSLLNVARYALRRYSF